MKITGLRALSLPVTLFFLPFSGCECDSDVVVIAPQIVVDVCNDPQIEVNGELLGGVRDCEVDFGAQPITTRIKKELVITNPSPVFLNIRSAEFTDDSDPSFEVESMPDGIEEGQTAIAVISYRPLVEGDQGGQLVIVSDAENLAEGEDVVIDMRGSGFDDGVPDLVVSPLECDYGRVAVEGIARCGLTIENQGQRALVFDEVVMIASELALPPEAAEDAEPFTFAGRPPQRDDALAPPPDDPGEGTPNVFELAVHFQPFALGNYQGQLAIRTNDPDTPVLIIPLSGIGVTPPQCDITVKSVNGLAFESNNSIEPLDDVVLTADASIPSTADGDITSVEWRILSKPEGSGATLTNPAGVETGFTFANGVLGIDLAGRYRIAARVIDDLGTASVNECELEFEAIPTDTILTQLTWDTSFGDMDFHFLKKQSDDRFCASSSLDVGAGLVEGCGTDFACYYGNCKASSSSRPDWDEDNVNGSEGDPSLDIDDLCGFGPENINIDVAAPGEYLVGVDFFGFTGCSGSGSIGNTVRVYLFGQLQAEFFKDMDNGDWWEVAVIYWPGSTGGQACIEDLSTTEEECAGFGS
jgi:hypothetical protein